MSLALDEKARYIYRLKRPHPPLYLFHHPFGQDIPHEDDAAAVVELARTVDEPGEGIGGIDR